MTDLSEAVAIVTGAGSGIGRGIALALRAEGAEIVVADVSAEAAAAVAAETDGLAVPTDVTDPVAVQELVDAALGRHGRIDVLVNNAGVGPQAAIADMTLEDWRWLLDVNLWGVIHGVAAVVPLMRAQGSGHIVNIASMSALAPMPPLGGYAVGKAGVAVLTEVLAAELEGTGVDATLVLPGPTRTAIGDSLRNRPGAAGALREFRNEPPAELWRTADEVGRRVAEAVRDREPIVVTHPELWGRVAARHERYAAAFRRAAAVPADTA
ncbi:SDR family oxidoreductase [Pseudonocardia xishanensis]|uniref:SDR family oxidoreductase n=1 Tax=Pseudonocardia xishanensis TaxID=630995 RepID=A0ABP8RPP7_9PSEU